MKFIVDSNILFTFFWKESVLKDILLRPQIELIAPEYALEEIKKYEEEICKKAEISKEELRRRKEELITKINFKEEKEYMPELKEARKIIEELPMTNEEKKEARDDLDFLALAIKEKCLLWSNDKILKKQSMIIVLATIEVIELLE